jgi:hypothetical protein
MKRMLPALYGALIVLFFIDAVFEISGSGESNSGAWLILLTALGAPIVHWALAIPVFAIQLVLLYLLGARIDAASARPVKDVSTIERQRRVLWWSTLFWLAPLILFLIVGQWGVKVFLAFAVFFGAVQQLNEYRRLRDLEQRQR